MLRRGFSLGFYNNRVRAAKRVVLEVEPIQNHLVQHLLLFDLADKRRWNLEKKLQTDIRGRNA